MKVLYFWFLTLVTLLENEKQTQKIPYLQYMYITVLLKFYFQAKLPADGQSELCVHKINKHNSEP